MLAVYVAADSPASPRRMTHEALHRPDLNSHTHSSNRADEKIFTFQ